MTAERRKRLLEVLEKRRFDTRTNLANELGVSLRTIENDIRVLQEHYPIYSQTGRNGGIYVMEGATLVRERMTAEETGFLEGMKSRTDEHGKTILNKIIERFGHIYRAGEEK